MRSPKSARRWPEAIVMACGAAPVVVTWLHACSNTPHRHPQPGYELTLVTAALGVLTTPLVARLLHCRLGGSWLAIAGLALADGFLQAGLARCQEPDFDLWRLLLFGYRACIRLEQGRTDEAVESAAIRRATLAARHCPASSARS